MDRRLYWRYRRCDASHVPNGVHCKAKTSTTQGSRWSQGSYDDKHDFSFSWHTTLSTSPTGTTGQPIPTPYSGIRAIFNKLTPRLPISTQFPSTLPWSGRSSAVPASRTGVSMVTEQSSSPGFCATRQVREMTSSHEPGYGVSVLFEPIMCAVQRCLRKMCERGGEGGGGWGKTRFTKLSPVHIYSIMKSCLMASYHFTFHYTLLVYRGWVRAVFFWEIRDQAVP